MTLKNNIHNNESYFYGRVIYFIPQVRLLALWVLIAGMVCMEATAQGFNWQYSARYPTSYPRFFVGASVSGAMMFNSVALDHFEIVPAGQDCFCALYNTGRGVLSTLGLHAEWWLQNSDIVLYSDLSIFRTTTILSSADVDNGPILRGGVAVPVITRYEMDVHLHFIGAEFGIKYSFYPSHFFVATGLHFAVRLSENVRQQELVITPAEYRFLSKPGVSSDGLSRSVEQNPVFSSFIPALSVQSGIDLPLSKGVYASPALMLVVPFFSMTDGGFWRWFAPGLKLSIVYGWN